MKNKRPAFCLTKSIATLLVTSACLTARVKALPNGEQVARGNASFNRAGSTLTIQAGDRAIINYQQFDIGRGEKVQFVQPGSDARVLNRVLDANPTRIFGTLEANGRVYLINPAGIFFESGAMINVGSLIAAAGNMSDQDFIAGRDLFTSLNGEVSNRGMINAQGDIHLFGSTVANFGSLVSRTGTVAMVAGDEVLLSQPGSHIYVKAKAVAPAGPAVRNDGRIQASRAVLAAGDLYSVAVSQTGIITSPDITVQSGRRGTTTIAGTLNAASTVPGTRGGKVKLRGGTVELRGALVDASGPAGGGDITVGGEAHGAGLEPNAETTLVDAATVIRADATVDGPGGNVVLWSDRSTIFNGRISAKGAGLGSGGFAEVSGRQTLSFRGTVDLTALSGRTGMLLLDPAVITIDNSAGANNSELDAGAVVPDPTINAGDSPGATFTISAAHLVNQLNLADISLAATATINFTVPIDASGGASHSLTATAPALVFSDGANISLNNALLRLAGAVTLPAGGSVTLATGSGNVNFTSTVAGAADLTINSTGITTFSGAVTTLASLTTNPGGTTSINGGTVTTTGAQSFNDAVILNAVANTTTVTGSSVTFASTLRSAVNGEESLIVTSPGQKTFGGAVGDNNQRFAALTANGGGTVAINGGTVTTTGAQSFNDAVIFNAVANTTTLTGSSVTFASTLRSAVNGEESLIVTSPGQKTFGGAVGDNNQRFAALTANGGGTVAINGGPIQTTDAQTFGDAVTLGAGTIFTGASGAFTGAIAGGGFDLTLDYSDVTTVNGNTFTDVRNFATGNGGTTNLSGNITTTGSQTYNDSVQITGTTTLASTNNAAITLANALNGGFGLTVNTTGATTFGGAVGGTTPLASLTTNIGTTAINGGAVTTTGAQIYHDEVTQGDNAIITAGSLTLDGPFWKAGGFNLTLFVDNLAFNGGKNSVTGTGTGTLTLAPSTPSRAISLFGNTGLSINSTDYEAINNTFAGLIIGRNDGTGAITVAAPLTLNLDTTILSLGGAVNFNSTINGSKRLTVTSNGEKTFKGMVGGGGLPLTSLTSQSANTGGTTTLSLTVPANATSITTTEDQSFLDDTATQPAATTLNARTVTFGKKLEINEGAIGTLTVNADLVFGANAEYVVQLKGSGRNGTGPISSDTISVTSTHTATITSGAIVSGSRIETTIQSTDLFSILTLAGTPSGNFNAPSSIVSIKSGKGTLDFSSTANAGGVTLKLVPGPFTWTGENISSNNWTMEDNWDVGQAPEPGFSNNLIFPAGASKLSTFNDFSSGSTFLSITFTGGGYTLTGNLIKLVGPATGGGGVGIDNRAGINRIDIPIVLGSNLIFQASTNTQLVFAATINSDNVARELSLKSLGTSKITFSGAVGGSAPLAKLTTDSTGTTEIGANITTGGDQTYANPVTIVGDAALQGGKLSLANTSVGTLSAGPYTLNLKSNAIQFTGTITSPGGQRAGQLVIEPAGIANTIGVAGGAGDLQLSNTTFLAIGGGFREVTIGRKDGTGTTTIGAISLQSPTTFVASTGLLDLTASINVGNQRLTLRSDNINFPATPALIDGAVNGNGQVAIQPGNLDTNIWVLDPVAPVVAPPPQTLKITATEFATIGANVKLISIGHQDGTGEIAVAGPLNLKTDLAFLSETGNVSFEGAVDSDDAAAPRSLTVNTGGVTTFSGLVGKDRALASLTTDAGGTTYLPAIALGAGSLYTVRTTGGQSYGDALVLRADTVLASADKNGVIQVGDIVFGGTVNSDAAATPRALTVNTGIGTIGETRFGGLVGSSFALASLTTDAGGTTSFGTGLAGAAGVTTVNNGTTSGGQTYHDAVILRAETVLASTFAGTATQGGDIVFKGTVDSFDDTARALTVNTGGETRFDGLVGKTSALASLTTDAGGTTYLTATPVMAGPPFTVRTTGGQSYGDALVLRADTVLASAVNAGAIQVGDIVFGGTVNSDGVTPPRALIVNTGGDTYFGGLVGGSLALASLTTDAGGTTTFNIASAGAPGVTTVHNGTATGGQTYHDAVILRADTVLASTFAGTATEGGDIVFEGTVDSFDAGTPRALAVKTTGDTYFGGLVGGSLALASLTTDAGGTTTFNIASAGAPGVTTVHNGTTSGGQTYHDAVILRANTVLASTFAGTATEGGDIVFKGTVDSFDDTARALTVNTGGETRFDGLVGNAFALASLTTDAGGTTYLTATPVMAGPPFTVRTTGGQSYGDALVLRADTVLASADKNGAIQVGDIVFGGTVNSDGANSEGVTTPRVLIVNTGGDTYFGGLVGGSLALASLTTDAGGTTTFNIASAGDPGVTTVHNGTASGGQTYHDAVILRADTVLASTFAGTATEGGDIAFDVTVNGDAAATPRALAVNTTGDTFFGGLVGRSYALASLTTDAGGMTYLPAIALGAGSPFTVRTTGGQSYGDALVLRADTVLASADNAGAIQAGDIAFGNTVNGDGANNEGLITPRALTVNTTGDTYFGGLVGKTSALASLTTDARGTTTFNIASAGAAGVTTVNNGTSTGGQTYNDAVRLRADTVLASTFAELATKGGDIAFKGTVDSFDAGTPRALAVKTTGDTFFGRLVGRSYALASLTTDAGGTTTFNIASAGAAAVTTVNNGTATGGQTYHDAVILRADTVLASTFAGTATEGGDIVFKGTVDSFDDTARALTVNTGGETRFDGLVGSNFALASLATDAGGTTYLTATPVNAGPPFTVRTTGGQSYGDALVLRADTVLASADKNGVIQVGDIVFGGTVNSDGANSEGVTTPRVLTVNTGGDTFFGDGVGDDRVGGIAALRSLTVDDVATVANWNGTTGERTVFNVDPTVADFVNTVRTTMGQTYHDAVVLRLDTVLTIANNAGVVPVGDIRFNSTVDSLSKVDAEARSLVVNTGGVTGFGDGAGDDRVGGIAALRSVTTDDVATVANWNGTMGERTVFNVDPTVADFVNTVRTTMGQTYHDAVVLALDTVLTSANNATTTKGGVVQVGNIRFNSTVDSLSNLDADARALTVNTGGETRFEGLIGSNRPLARLITDDSSAQNWSSEHTSGERTVLTVSGTKDNPSLLAVGRETKITDLLGENGVPDTSKDKTAVVAVSFGDPVHLIGDIVVASGTIVVAGEPAKRRFAPGIGNIWFLNSVDTAPGTPPASLTVNTGQGIEGETWFKGNVGSLVTAPKKSGTPLAALETDAGGTVRFGESYDLPAIPTKAVTINASAQSYRDDLAVIDRSVKLTGSNVRFDKGTRITGNTDGDDGAPQGALKVIVTGTVTISEAMQDEPKGSAEGLRHLSITANSSKGKIDVNDLLVTGNLSLAAHGAPVINQPAPLLLRGNTYSAANISFNDFTGAHQSLATISHVSLSQGDDLIINAGGKFAVGREQNFLVDNGTLIINAGKAVLGDTAARYELQVNSRRIEILARPVRSGANVAGVRDEGVSLVSAAITLGSQPTVIQRNITERAFITDRDGKVAGVQSTTVLAVGANSNVDKQFLGAFGQPTGTGESVPQPVGAGEPLPEEPQAPDAPVPTAFVDPNNESFEGLALPIDSTALNPPDGNLDLAIKKLLQQIGIELREILFADEAASLKTRGSTMYRQPIEGQEKMTEDEFRVVRKRITKVEMMRLVKIYQGIVGETGEQRDLVRDALAKAVEDYTAETTPPPPLPLALPIPTGELLLPDELILPPGGERILPPAAPADTGKTPADPVPPGDGVPATPTVPPSGERPAPGTPDASPVPADPAKSSGSEPQAAVPAPTAADGANTVSPPVTSDGAPADGSAPVDGPPKPVTGDQAAPATPPPDLPAGPAALEAAQDSLPAFKLDLSTTTTLTPNMEPLLDARRVPQLYPPPVDFGDGLETPPAPPVNLANLAAWLKTKTTTSNANAAQCLAVLERLRLLYNQVGTVGLTKKELQISQEKIARNFTSGSLSAEVLRTLIAESKAASPKSQPIKLTPPAEIPPPTGPTASPLAVSDSMAAGIARPGAPKAGSSAAATGGASGSPARDATKPPASSSGDTPSADAPKGQGVPKSNKGAAARPAPKT